LCHCSWVAVQDGKVINDGLASHWSCIIVVFPPASARFWKGRLSTPPALLWNAIRNIIQYGVWHNFLFTLHLPTVAARYLANLLNI